MDAEAEGVAAILDAFDDAVGGGGVDGCEAAGGADGLVVGGVDLHRVGFGDAVQEGAGGDGDGVAGLIAGVWLFVFEGVLDAVGDVLEEGAAEGDGEELLTAADAEDGHVAGEGAADEGQFGGGSGFLQGDGGVAVVVAVEVRVDVEGAAGDDEGVDAVEEGGGEARVMREGDGQAAGCGEGRGIVGAEGVPGVFRVSAGLLCVEGDADEGSDACAHVAGGSAARWGGARDGWFDPAMGVGL